jgi:hypothetical protein
MIAKDFRFTKDFPLIGGKSFVIMTLACLDTRQTGQMPLRPRLLDVAGNYPPS